LQAFLPETKDLADGDLDAMDARRTLFGGKDHNAGGKSHWMDGFWNQPSPPLWQVIDQ
jgi:hypothetical protein